MDTLDHRQPAKGGTTMGEGDPAWIPITIGHTLKPREKIIEQHRY